MIRLPRVGEEERSDILNESLLVAHNADGIPRRDNPELLAATIGLANPKTTNPPGQSLKTLVLSNDGTDLVWKNTIEVNVVGYGAKGDEATDLYVLKNARNYS